MGRKIESRRGMYGFEKNVATRIEVGIRSQDPILRLRNLQLQRQRCSR
jgi:hypothetical protein